MFGPMLLLAVLAGEPAIQGDYLEARNADVWTGPCFSNSEIGIVGNKAILGWKVSEGSFDGVNLAGLGVAAVVIGDSTFGIGREVTSRSIILVDEKADPSQRRALVELARRLAGTTLGETLEVRATTLKIRSAYCDGLGCASLESKEAKVRTRCIEAKDSVCGHEQLDYPPLADASDVHAAYTLENEYRGKQLGERFQDSNARSAMLGRFSL